jgi:uncharacterized protein (TIGR02231 family)
MNATLLLLLAAAPAIDSVVVFPDRAQVTRATTVDCGARRAVAFTGITPAASVDSFRARVPGGGSVDGLRVEKKARADALTAQFNELKAKLRALDADAQVLQDELGRARIRSQLGQKYLQVAVTEVQHEMALERPDTKAWQQAFDSARGARTQGDAAQTDVAVKLRALQLKREELQRKLDALGYAAQREEVSAEVVVSCPQGSKARVELTYLVGGARWTPSYEAHADESGGGVELSAFATLAQSTGESWDQAKLTLSTAVPAQNATPPELKRLQVAAQERLPEKKVLVRRDEQVGQAEGGESTVSGGDSQALKVRAQGLSVQLEVPERATVLGDGSAQRLFVASHKLKAQFGLRTAPRLQPFVFRVAELKNQAPFPLLPGDLAAFRGSSLVARYGLKRVAEGAVFHLTFGIDDALRVKRVVLEEIKRDAGLFNTKKRFSYGYRFELGNWSKGPVELELWESLPVSEVDDVAVTMGEKTTTGYQLNSADGIAKWKVKLGAGEQKNVELAYKVDVPGSYDIGGL